MHQQIIQKQVTSPVVAENSDFSVVRGNDFISHVEETLISHDDDWTHRQAIGELEEAFAYGDKSRFRYEHIKLFD